MTYDKSGYSVSPISFVCITSGTRLSDMCRALKCQTICDDAIQWLMDFKLKRKTRRRQRAGDMRRKPQNKNSKRKRNGNILPGSVDDCMMRIMAYFLVFRWIVREQTGTLCILLYALLLLLYLTLADMTFMAAVSHWFQVLFI